MRANIWVTGLLTIKIDEERHGRESGLYQRSDLEKMDL